MSTQYFMRVRGRVLGPYEEDKLQALAHRGQLSKMHEVSTDGLTWARASHFPNLFAGAPVSEPAATQIVEQLGSERQGTSAPQSPGSQMPPSAQGQWFYTSGGMQRGPIDFSQLQLLTASGQLSDNDQVWTEGMPGWIAAKAVPGLATTKPSNSKKTKTEGSNGEGGKLPSAVCKSAVGARGWALLVATVIDIVAALQLIGGFFALIIGARDRDAAGVAGGLFSMVHAAVWIAGGLLLHTYCRRLGAVALTSEAIPMEHAMDALRAFWVFAGVYLIVILTFTVVGVISLFAAGVISI